MPTSVFYNLPAICELIDVVSPATMLDIGVGNGRIGFLARDILDVMHQREGWQKTIDGIEVFPAYIQDHQRAIYNTIHIGDALEVIDSLGTYDLVYMGDVLEHFEKEDGWAMLDKIARHTSRYMGIAVPLGDTWVQGALFDNEHEEHKAVWQLDELDLLADKQWLFTKEGHPDECGYGLFLIEPNNYRHYRARLMADTHFEAGRASEAVTLLVECSKEGQPNKTTDYQLTDYLIKMEMKKEAIAVLEKCSHHFPNDAETKELLATLTRR